MRSRIRFAIVAALAAASAVPAATRAQIPDSATLASFRYRAIGPVNMGSRITDIEADPHSSKILYIAAATGGIWKSVNAGTTFFPLWEHENVASMGAIAIAPSNTNVIWAGTGESNARNSASPGRGVYKSVDAGLTWTLMGLEKTQHIGRIIVHPTNPDIVYVAAIGDLWNSNPERGLYKTIDGGKTWQLIKFISDKAGFVDLLMDPRDPNTLYAASWERVRKVYTLKSGGPGSGLWKTTDGGKTWHEVKGGGFPETMKGRIGLALAASNPNIVYALVEADSIRGAKPQRLLSGLYRSADAGKTWTWMSTEDNRPFYFSQIRIDPKNPNRVYRMAINFQFSDDGGHSWKSGMVGNHEDYHAMWIDPNDPEHYLIGGDAGIFQTWDKGGTYDALNQMPIAQFYNISFDYAVPYRICGGMQDNGTSCGISRRRSGALQMTDWFAVNSADGFHTAQDWSDPNIIYYESQGGNMSRRNLATGEVVNIKPHTAAVSTYGRQIEQILADTGGGPLPGAPGALGGQSPAFARPDSARAGAVPNTPSPPRPALTPEQKKQQTDQIRARMKEDMANPNSAQRWNWNSPFILSQFDPNVFYSGSERVFKSVLKGSSPFAISGDLSTQDPDRLRMANGYDAEGNVAPDPSGGITNDAAAWLAEQNGTVVSLVESPMRAGFLFAGTDDGNVWMTRNDGGTWDNLSGRCAGVPAKTYVSRIEPSHFDSGTVYVSYDNHRENDLAPYLCMSTDFGKTFHSIVSDLPTALPNYIYVVRDPFNRSLLYLGTELGVFASLDRGTHWFRIHNNLPTVPVYDLKIHPRDHELIVATHGRAIQILDVAPLEQLADSVLAKPAYLFAPTIAFQYSDAPEVSELRAQRGWKGDGGPYGAEIAYRLAASAQSVRVSIVTAGGDTVARLVGPTTPGINRVLWNFQQSETVTQLAGGGGRGGGRGGGGVGGGPGGGRGAASAAAADSFPGFPPGFNPRPAESRGAPDSSSSPTNVVAGGRGGRGAGGGGRGGAAGSGRAAAPPDTSGGRGAAPDSVAGRGAAAVAVAGGRGGRGGGAGGRGAGGGGGGRGAGGGGGAGRGGGGRPGAPTGLAPTGDYRVVLDVDSTHMTQVLRVVKLDDQGPGAVYGAPKR